MAMMGSWRKKGVIGTPGYSEDTSMNTAPLRIGDAGGVPLLPDGVSDISLGGGEHLASPQTAPRTSCDRTAVKTKNSKARAPKPSRPRRAANQRGASSSAKAG